MKIKKLPVKKFTQLLAFSICAFTWLVLMPLGVGPDDNWNVTMNYCALGDREGLCQDRVVDTGSVWNIAKGPSDITKIGACFRQKYQLSATCSNLSRGGGASAKQIKGVQQEELIATLYSSDQGAVNDSHAYKLFLECDDNGCLITVFLFRESKETQKIAESNFANSDSKIQLTFTQAVNSKTSQIWQDDNLLVNFETPTFSEKAKVFWNEDFFQASAYDEPLDKSLATIYPAPTYSPPFYFAAMSWLSTENVERSVWAMRIWAALVVIFMLLMASILVRERTFRLLIVSLLTTGIPMGFFLFGTNNPSLWSWIGVSVAAALAYDLGFRRFRGLLDHAKFLAAFTFVAFCAASRADSAIYSMLGVFAAFILASNYKMNVYLRTYTLVITTLISLWVYSNTQSLKIHATLHSQDSLLSSVFHPLLESLGVLFGNQGDRGPLGAWGLSWYDSPNPTSVTYLTVLALVILAATSLQHVNRIHLIVNISLIALTLLFLLRGLIATSENPPGGFIQPRYLLPMVTLTLLFILFSRNSLSPSQDSFIDQENSPVPNTTRSAVIASLSAISFGLATLVTATRFGNGLEVRRGVWLDGLHSLGPSFDFVGVGYLFYKLPEVSTFFTPILPNLYFVIGLILVSSISMWYVLFVSLRTFLR
jgi:hypothetical protein